MNEKREQFGKQQKLNDIFVLVQAALLNGKDSTCSGKCNKVIM